MELLIKEAQEVDLKINTVTIKFIHFYINRSQEQELRVLQYEFEKSKRD